MDKREKAADNMIMLAKERVGVLGTEIVFGDLGKTDMERVKMIASKAEVHFFLNTLNPSDEEVVNAVV